MSSDFSFLANRINDLEKALEEHKTSSVERSRIIQEQGQVLKDLVRILERIVTLIDPESVFVPVDSELET